MRLTFNGWVRESEGCKGILLNTITVYLNGKEVVLDRDITEYTIHEDGSVDITWINVYVWNGDYPDYNISSEMFKSVTEMLTYEVEDDVDERYILNISKPSIHFS